MPERKNIVGEKSWVEKTRGYSVWDDKNIKGFFGPYMYLSNFQDALVVFEGSRYPTSEHAYMAAKTKNKAERVPLQVGGHVGDASPFEAKKYGRNKIVLRDDWEDVKVDFMFIILHNKFSCNQYLRRSLLGTGDKYLEETNHWGDKCWGVDANTGEGENNLGKVLMRVRAML